MARHGAPAHAGHGRTACPRAGYGLRGLRPDRRLAPHRAPLLHHDSAPLPACRPQAPRPRRRRHRHDRRPLRQERRAQPADRRGAPPQRSLHQGTAGPLPRLRQCSAQRRRTGRQLRLDARLHFPRLRPRSRQAHHGELHDGQRQREEAPERRSARRALIHGVHLPALAGLRLPPPLPDQEL